MIVPCCYPPRAASNTTYVQVLLSSTLSQNGVDCRGGNHQSDLVGDLENFFKCRIDVQVGDGRAQVPVVFNGSARLWLQLMESILLCFTSNIQP